MNNLNSVLLEGKVTGEPVLTKTPKGTQVCMFTVAVNRYYRKEDEIVKEESFFLVETWSRLAEYCNAQLFPKMSIRVVGRLMQERYEDYEINGHNRIKVIAEHLEVMKG